MSSGDCPVNWIVCPPCEGIPDALGHSPYSYSQIADAPWYDVQEEPSHRFLGVHAISMDGLNDSTRQASIAEGINDGGVVGNVRHAVRQVRVRALLSALGEDALESGLAWLKAALDPDTCGTHGNACGAVDSCFYVACPPTRAEVTKPAALWGDPIINLATNPSFETAGALIGMRTNLATNPSFEATTAATVEVRRNLFVDPTFTQVGFAAQAGGGVLTVGSDGGFSGTTYLRETFASGGPAASGIDCTGPSAIVTGAGPHSVSIYVRPSFAVSMQLTMIHAAASGATSVVQPIISCPANVWTRLTWQGTLTATGQFGIRARTTGATVVPVGGTIDYDAALIEQSSVVDTYFDGALVPAGDFTFAWTGTANNSPSVQYGLAAPGMSGGNSAAIISSDWASSGAKSLRLHPTTTSNIVSTIISVTLLPGKTYTAVAKLRLTGPVGGAGQYARQITFVQTGFTTQAVVVGTNAAGVYEGRLVFTTDPAMTTYTLRLGGGGDTINDVWWDDLLIVEGNYAGPYFDGSGPPKIRRNLALNPRAIEGGSSFQPSSGGTASFITDYPGPVPTAARFTQTVAGTGMFGPSVGSAFPRGTVVQVSMKVRASEALGGASIRHRPAGIGSTGGEVVWGTAQGMPATIPAGESVIVVTGTTSATTPNGSNMLGPRWTTGTVGATLDITEIVIEEVPAVAGGFFDGATPAGGGVQGAWEGTANASPSYLADPDFTYSWTGTPNASTSIQSALPYTTAQGVPTSFPDQAVRYQTSDTPAGRAKAMRYDIATTGAVAIATVNLNLVNGSAYTVLGKVRAKTRDQVFTPRVEGTTGPTFTAPKGVWTEFRLTAVAGGGSTSTTGLLLVAGGGHQVGDIIDVDNVAVVEGEYGGDYFDGSFPDVPTFDETQPITLPIGTTLNRYEWTGTADASTSVHESGIIVAVEDPEGFDLLNDSLLRSMHNVTCISGPLIEQKLHRDDLWGYIVEFTLAAGTPWLFGVTREVKIPNGFPIVIQDVPFNLIRYPSAELTAGTITVSTNYAANPSVETNDTGWVKTSSGTPAADTVGARSTTLAAQGTASYRIRFTATTTSASASTIRADHQTATFPAAVAGTRMSVNMWATSQVASGTAVVSQTRIFVIWRQGSTVLRTDTLGTVPAGGGAVSGKSLVPPVGADNAIVRAEATVDSWSTGAVIDVYADAVAVTVP